jgi:hypothetical protein
LKSTPAKFRPKAIESKAFPGNRFKLTGQLWVKVENKTILLRNNVPIPSLESLFGWQSQYARMLRWHDCSKNDPSLDTLLAFFLNCYALRDWLHKTAKLDAKVIGEAIKVDLAMKLCRDLCNRSKRPILTKPSVDANFVITREYRGTTSPVGLMLHADQMRTDLTGVADRCVRFWQQFLRDQGLHTN